MGSNCYLYFRNDRINIYLKKNGCKNKINISLEYFNEKDILSLEEDKANEEEIVENIRKGVVFKGTNLWTLVFSIFIASIGLNVNSTAVIIGAMLVSPLMGPIMGVGLGLGIYDFEFKNFEVNRETFISGKGIKNGFIDFTIEIDKYYIAIEMKIDSKENGNQLDNYKAFLDSIPNKEKRLYYLTLFGDEADKSKIEEDKYIRISFSKDISNFPIA